MSIDYAEEKKTARDRLFDTLCDLQWHGWQELKSVAGHRYSARLLELKREGYDIVDAPFDDVQGKKYRLTSLEKGAPQQKMVRIYAPEHVVSDILSSQVLRSQHRPYFQEALDSFRANKDKL